MIATDPVDHVQLAWVVDGNRDGSPCPTGEMCFEDADCTSGHCDVYTQICQ